MAYLLKLVFKMVIGDRLKQLSQQINFLLEIEQDSLEECVQELGSLLVFLEQETTKSQDEESFKGLDVIRRKLSEDYNKMSESYQKEINYLKEQKNIVEQALTVENKNPETFSELEKIILEDVGELESNDLFKERILKTNQANRAEFLNVIEEIRESIEEGSIDELAEYFEAVALDEAETAYEENFEEEIDDSCDEEDAGSSVHDFDLTNNQNVVDLLKKISEPYFVEDAVAEKKS